MSEEEIKKLLDDKIKEAAGFIFKPPAPGSEIIDLVVNAIVEQIDFEKDTWMLFRGLLLTLDSLSIQSRWANVIFREIRGRLRDSQPLLDKDEDDELKIGRHRIKTIKYESVLRDLRNAAIDYLKEEIYKEMATYDLPKQLIEIKKTLDREGFEKGDYVHQTLLKIQEEVEKKINFEKEEAEHREALKILSASELTEDSGEPQSPDGKHFTPRNEKQVFLALQMITELLSSSGNKKENAAMMSFLSGFSSESMRQSVSKSESWADKKEALEYIRKLSIECKWVKLAKKADEEIKLL